MTTKWGRENEGTSQSVSQRAKRKTIKEEQESTIKNKQRNKTTKQNGTELVGKGNGKANLKPNKSIK